jgi:WD40 repeat protein
MVRVWSSDGSGEAHVYRVHDQPILYLEWSPDSKRIVTASDDATAGCGTRMARENRWSFAVTHGGCSLRRSVPDGARIFTTSADETVRVWNVDGSGEPTF